LDAIFEKSKPTMPVVFITSPASDAIGDLVKLAERSGFGGSKFCSLCLGQGQELVSLVPLLKHISDKTYFEYNNSGWTNSTQARVTTGFVVGGYKLSIDVIRGNKLTELWIK